nr:tetratricopeptide repeat protein [uncultured Desulfobacter sp.]
MKIFTSNNRFINIINSGLKYFAFFFFLYLLILPDNVSAKMNKGIFFTRNELAAMPRWCQNRIIVQNQWTGTENRGFGKNVPESAKLEYEKWTKVIGKDVIRYTHHYCTALNWINRYKLSLPQNYKAVEADRKEALSSAMNEFNFLRGYLKPKHKLFYSQLMNEAYIYKEQGNLMAAVKNYRKILKFKPGYVPAYIRYAQLLDAVGKNDDAIKILRTGLKKTKGAKSIKNEITRIEESGSSN